MSLFFFTRSEGLIMAPARTFPDGTRPNMFFIAVLVVLCSAVGAAAVSSAVAGLLTLTDPSWENTVVIKDNVVEELKKIKEEDGPNLHVYGSANLIQTLLKHDLVDEMWLKIFPVTLGKGKKLFEEGTMPVAWKLTDSKVSPSGVIFANYKRDGEVKTGSFA